MASVLTLLKASLDFYRAQFQTLSGYLAWLLLPFAGAILATFIPNESIADSVILLFVVIQIVLWIWISIFLIRLINSLLHKQAPDHSLLQSESWGLILPVLIVAVIELAAIIGGFLLLIIPGIIFIIWFDSGLKNATL